MSRSPLVMCLTVAAAIGIAAARDRTSALPLAQPNDNRQPAGTLENGVLTLNLEVRAAVWYPEGEPGPGVQVAAFAEAGSPPAIPGPLIRVPAGTTIQVSVRNMLTDSTVTIHGFATRPSAVADTMRIPPGESRVTLFTAGSPGTYFYWAEVGAYKADPNRLARERVQEREQLAGALIVDPPGTHADDRVFVISVWGERLDSATYRNALVINGQSWPFTERIAATLGDTLRWRVINTSARPHPMHLHGFYYMVAAAGTALANRVVPSAERPLVVTNELRPFQTMDVAWEASRAGNWLFHCHTAFHVVPESRLVQKPALHQAHSADAQDHMAGLVLGVSVRDTAPPRAAVAPTRHLRLLVQEGRPRARAPRALGFVLQRDVAPPAPDSIEIPGTTLVLTRGEVTGITVVNRLREGTAVHWHGIELESYWDGVAGWSGVVGRQAPAIAPGDSFTANLILPRAGTFIYHTHFNDVEQLTSGLYGALVVLEPGQSWDPATDHVVVLSWDGNFVPAMVLLDGASVPAPLVLAAGRTHRLRFVNIGAALPFAFTLARDTTPARWRPLAKDGADLPAALQLDQSARLVLSVGETRDVAFAPPAPGSYVLRATTLDGRRTIARAVIVR